MTGIRDQDDDDDEIKLRPRGRHVGNRQGEEPRPPRHAMEKPSGRRAAPRESLGDWMRRNKRETRNRKDDT